MHDPPRILIVDDNETNRDILATRLRTHGYDLCQAADGEAALAAAETLLPDLILLDVMMPKLNGIEVCRRLKKDAALPFMAIILVTAKADSKDIVVGLDAGADEYLTKPVDQAALDWIDRRFNSGAGAMWFFTRSVDVTSSPGAGGGVLDDDAIGAAVVDQPPALFAVIVCGVDKAAINPIFRGAARLNLITEARRYCRRTLGALFDANNPKHAATRFEWCSVY
jgi:CheY-like chemotaxis protein